MARGCVAGSAVPAGLAGFLRRPLLELRDELLDLEPQSFQRREEPRLELALELLAFLEEVLHQVAEPVRQPPPGGDAVDFRGMAGLALLGQRVHTSLLFEGRCGRLQVYAAAGCGFRGRCRRQRNRHGLCIYYASVRLAVWI